MKYKFLFWLILITGLALRLYHTWTAPYAYANSDNCIIWLMAKHILEGEFPLFFYGQYYMGPLEALTIAFFFMLFGIKVSTLHLGTIFYSGLFISSAYFLGKELRDRTTGLLIMLYSAFPSSYFFGQSIYPGGYHIEILFLGNVMFILTLKIPDISAGMKKTIYYILLGLFAGIGVWTHYIIFYYLAPVAIYLLINEKWKNLLKNFIPTAISFFLIGLPFWIFTFRYNFVTFKFRTRSIPSGAVLNFFKLLVEHISHMFDIDYSHISLIVLGIYVISILYFVLSPSFKKKSVFIYLFIFILLFYIGYRSKTSVGEGYNYILPVLTFISTVFGYFGSYLIRRIKVVGLCIVLLVISFNIKNLCERIHEYKNMSNSHKQIIYDRIRFLEDNKILRFIGHEENARVPVFFSNEKIIVTGFLDGQYIPYEDIVEKSDRIAFEKCGDDWRSVLDNICMSYDFQQELFYNFKPHPYRTRVVRLKGSPAYDRNYDNYWATKAGKKTDMSFTIDMGRPYTICKIEILNAHHRFNYPISCKIQVSKDRHDWQEAAYIKNIQPLFWSGPRPYWRLVDGRLEWFFKPVEARFVRLVQIGEDPENPWEINEMFIYEYLGYERYRIMDFVKDAKDIISFCIKKNINFIYADFWLSAKTRDISKGKVEALAPYNSYLPLRKNMSREVVLGRDRAFVVRLGDAEGLETIFSEFELPFKKVIFRQYAFYYLPNLPKEYESMPSLMWIGIGMVRHSLKDYSDWLYRHGYYKKALRYYPNNFMAYLRCKILPHTRFFPDMPKTISFVNGIRFLGYSLRGSKLRQGGMVRMEYFWEVQKEPDENLCVFVHFVKDGSIIFQNDHKFLYQFSRPLVPLEGERFREVLRLKIPEGIQPGVYQIIFGLWDEKKGQRIYVKDPSGKKIHQQGIGELII